MPPSPHNPTAEELTLHFGFVRALAHALVRDPYLAEDVAQETMLAAFERPVAVERGLKTWLRGVLLKRIQFHYRGEGRRKARETALATERGAEGESEDVAGEALLRAEQSRMLSTAVARLREPYRTVIVLRFQGGLGPQAIARKLGTPVNTIHTHLQRGLEQLRGELDRSHDGDRGAWCLALAPLAGPAPAPLVSAASTVAGLWIAAATAAVAVILPLAWQALGARRTAPARVGPSEPVAVLRADEVPAVRALAAPLSAGERTALVPAELEVLVTDTSGRPLAGAELLALDSHATLVADADGRARFPRTSAGEHEVALLTLHPDHAPDFRRLATGETDDVLVELAPLVPQDVLVLDAETGLPIADARVAYAAYFSDPIGPSPATLPCAVVGKVGESVYAAVRAHLPADDSDPRRTDRYGVVELSGPDGGVAFLDVDAPGYESLRAARVPCGADAVVELALRHSSTLRLVRGPEVTGPLHAQLRRVTGRSFGAWQTLAPDCNELVLDAPEGVFDVAAIRSPEPPERRFGDKYSFERSRGEREDLAGRLFTRPASLVAGTETTVTLFDGEGLGFTVQVSGGPPTANVFVYLEGEALQPFLASIPERGAAEFEFAQVPPGSYTLLASFGGKLVYRELRTFGPRDDGSVIRLQLGSGSLEVEQLGPTCACEGGAQSHLLIGPLDRPDVRRGSWDRVGERVRFDALVPGKYELWYLHRARASKREVDIGPGLQTLAIEPLQDPVRRLIVQKQAPFAGDELRIDVLHDIGLGLRSDRYFSPANACELGIVETPEFVEFALAPATYQVCIRSATRVVYAAVDLTAGDVELFPDDGVLEDYRLELVRGDAPVVLERVGLTPHGIEHGEDRILAGRDTSAEGWLDVRIAPGSYSLWTTRGEAVPVVLAAGEGVRRIDVSAPPPE